MRSPIQEIRRGECPTVVTLGERNDIKRFLLLVARVL
jgi:hypothetical protein